MTVLLAFDAESELVDEPPLFLPDAADWRFPMVRLACDRCERKGQYRRETLIEKYGLEVRMPDLRHLIAQCPRHGTPGRPAGCTTRT